GAGTGQRGGDRHGRNLHAREEIDADPSEAEPPGDDEAGNEHDRRHGPAHGEVRQDHEGFSVTSTARPSSSRSFPTVTTRSPGSRPATTSTWSPNCSPRRSVLVRAFPPSMTNARSTPANWMTASRGAR